MIECMRRRLFFNRLWWRDRVLWPAIRRLTYKRVRLDGRDYHLRGDRPTKRITFVCTKAPATVWVGDIRLLQFNAPHVCHFQEIAPYTDLNELAQAFEAEGVA